MTKPEMKEYTKIIRYGKVGTEELYQPGDEIIVQEKIDGSNASIVRYNNEKKVHKFSKSIELEGEVKGQLNGFVRWVDESVDGMGLIPNLVYFFEYTGKQKVKYPEHNKKPFLIDIYDLDAEEYMPFDFLLEEASLLGFEVAPVLYRGEFISVEHLQSLVGLTELGGMLKGEPGGEGIVIKGNRKNRFGRRVFTKMVVAGFKEVKHYSDAERTERLRQAENTPERLFVVDTVTDARVDKIMYKLQTEGVLPEVLTLKVMGDILRNVSKRVYDDIMEEERDMLPEVFDSKLVTKGIGVVLPAIVKRVLLEREEN